MFCTRPGFAVGYRASSTSPCVQTPDICLVCQDCKMNLKDSVCLCMLVSGYKTDKKSMFIQSFSVFMYINIVEPLGWHFSFIVVNVLT